MTTEHEGAENNGEGRVACELTASESSTSESGIVNSAELNSKAVDSNAVDTNAVDTNAVQASDSCQGSCTSELGQERDSAAEPSSTDAPQISDVQAAAMLEALLLASGDPLSLSRIAEASGLAKGRIKDAADRLAERYGSEESGIELVVVAEKLQLRTKAAFADQVRGLMAVKPRKLSQAALETLAVIAYQQPVVKSEVDKIRGVDVAPTIKTLLERKLVKIIGYQASVGQPALYGTTEDFLQVFGLSSLSALPAMRDLKALVKEPGEAQQEEEESVEDEVEAPIAEDAQEAVVALAVEAAPEAAPVQ
jgi:segregation and condensation protein B